MIDTQEIAVTLRVPVEGGGVCCGLRYFDDALSV